MWATEGEGEVVIANAWLEGSSLAEKFEMCVMYLNEWSDNKFM